MNRDTNNRFIKLDPKIVSQKAIYHFLTGAVTPRPIAFVSTINLEGIGNLAPFSFYNAVSSAPPAVMISIAHKANGDKKDTLKNIELTEEFEVSDEIYYSKISDAYNKSINSSEKIDPSS